MPHSLPPGGAVFNEMPRYESGSLSGSRVGLYAQSPRALPSGRGAPRLTPRITVPGQ